MSMPNVTLDGGCFSSGSAGGEEVQQLQQQLQQHDQRTVPFHGPAATSNSDSSTSPRTPPPLKKKKRNLPGTPDPTAEVIALSPKTLMATNRFVCEICNKGFQRDQNLQLHRRGHNLPWKLRQRTSTEIRKRVYVCPEATCVHHNPSRALGDLTGIKKHFCRKHGEKKWKCDKCAKKYAVQSDLKAHSKTCGTREYKCDCGTVFSRRDSFITHRAFCDALAQENNIKANHGLIASMAAHSLGGHAHDPLVPSGVGGVDTGNMAISDFNDVDVKNPLKALSHDLMQTSVRALSMAGGMFSGNHALLLGPRSSAKPTSPCLQLAGSQAVGPDVLSGGDVTKTSRLMAGSAHMSATALLQKAAQMGATASGNVASPTAQKGFVVSAMAGSDQVSGMRPYAGMQPHVPYDHTQLAGGLGNQFFNTSAGGAGSAFNGTAMLPTTAAAGLWVAGDNYGHGFLEEVEQQGGGGTNLIHGSNGSGRSRVSATAGGGSGDMTTVDFLGVGGASLQEQQRQRLRHGLGVELGYGHANQQLDFQDLHPLQQQQQLVYGQSAFEKLSWDV